MWIWPTYHRMPLLSPGQATMHLLLLLVQTESPLGVPYPGVYVETDPTALKILLHLHPAEPGKETGCKEDHTLREGFGAEANGEQLKCFALFFIFYCIHALYIFTIIGWLSYFQFMIKASKLPMTTLSNYGKILLLFEISSL